MVEVKDAPETFAFESLDEPSSEVEGFASCPWDTLDRILLIDRAGRKRAINSTALGCVTSRIGSSEGDPHPGGKAASQQANAY